MNENKNSHSIKVQIVCEQDDADVDPNQLREIAIDTCQQFLCDKATINIKIVGDLEITELNKKFLNHHTTTDCISFNLSESRDDEKTFDIVVNSQIAQRQAQKRNHTQQAELCLYVVHGLLHQFGFDDLIPDKAKIMHEKEDEILNKYDLGSVYKS